jgi:hypothetical protein
MYSCVLIVTVDMNSIIPTGTLGKERKIKTCGHGLGPKRVSSNAEGSAMIGADSIATQWANGDSTFAFVFPLLQRAPELLNAVGVRWPAAFCSEECGKHASPSIPSLRRALPAKQRRLNA